jgi:hypothetical protein
MSRLVWLGLKQYRELLQAREKPISVLEIDQPTEAMLADKS